MEVIYQVNNIENNLVLMSTPVRNVIPDLTPAKKQDGNQNLMSQDNEDTEYRWIV